MRLYETMMTDCTMLNKTSVPDGVGGFAVKWVDGAKFKAAITDKSTGLEKIAQAITATESFNVLVEKGTRLAVDDVFRRDADGAIFKVTSNIIDGETPKVASFKFGQVTAERWKLT